MKYLVIGRIEKNIPFEKGEEINRASMKWIEKSNSHKELAGL